MRIKKSPSKNEYIRAGDVWVRNFTKPNVRPYNISHMYSPEEHKVLMANEVKNKSFAKISDEQLHMEKVIIVSDGHSFQWKHLCLAKFPSDVFIMAINRALRNWRLMSEDWGKNKRPINAYVANNPFPQILSCLPNHFYFPSCIASSRTNFEFLKQYSGNRHVYEPALEKVFGTEKQERYFIDDYRNPICAAIGLAYRFGVKELMLVSCDDSFPKKKDGAEQLPNGLWTYPQHLRAQEIIDANLYWLTHQEERKIKVADWSDGMKYTNAAYISSEEEAISFFTEEGTS